MGCSRSLGVLCFLELAKSVLKSQVGVFLFTKIHGLIWGRDSGTVVLYGIRAVLLGEGMLASSRAGLGSYDYIPCPSTVCDSDVNANDTL